MPILSELNNGNAKVLVLGSGGLSIGQAESLIILDHKQLEHYKKKVSM